MYILAFILTVNIVAFIVAFAFHVADIIVYGETGIMAITAYELMSDWNIRLWVHILLFILFLPLVVVDTVFALLLCGIVKFFKSPNIKNLFFKK